MRLHNKNSLRAFAQTSLTLALAAGLAGCASSGGGAELASAASKPVEIGPQADYPVLVGEPYQIAGVTHTPTETLNYDEVGVLAEARGLKGYAAAHHTLPIPSYVEVTSLETGRTVLVRLQQRGPMDSNDVIALSPAALAQLGASAQTAVRVRRAVPPEEQRAMLRAGQAAPLRMDTPESLLTVLRRKLPSGTAVAMPKPPELAEKTASQPVEVEPVRTANEVALPPLQELPEQIAENDADASFAEAFGEPDPASVAASQPSAQPKVSAATPPRIEAGFVVQAGAFSTRDRANRVATSVGGQVSPVGALFRVRTGPFASRGEAEASLAKLRAAGYTDARILTSG